MHFGNYHFSLHFLVGNPASGYVLASPQNPENLRDLNALARRQIIPLLKRAHIEWKGWHAFRRGNPPFLAPFRSEQEGQERSLSPEKALPPRRVVLPVRLSRAPSFHHGYKVTTKP